jgi:hypothetical protein
LAAAVFFYDWRVMAEYSCADNTKTVIPAQAGIPGWSNKVRQGLDALDFIEG